MLGMKLRPITPVLNLFLIKAKYDANFLKQESNACQCISPSCCVFLRKALLIFLRYPSEMCPAIVHSKRTRSELHTNPVAYFLRESHSNTTKVSVKLV